MRYMTEYNKKRIHLVYFSKNFTKIVQLTVITHKFSSYNFCKKNISKNIY